MNNEQENPNGQTTQNHGMKSSKPNDYRKMFAGSAKKSNQKTSNLESDPFARPTITIPKKKPLFQELSSALSDYLQLPVELVQTAIVGAVASAAQGAFNLKLPNQEGIDIFTPLSLHVLITASPNERIGNLIKLLFNRHESFERKTRFMTNIDISERSERLAAWKVEYAEVERLLKKSVLTLITTETPTAEQEREHERIKKMLGALARRKPAGLASFRMFYNNTTPTELIKSMSQTYRRAILVNSDASETLKRWQNEDMSQFRQVWQGLSIEVDYAKEKSVDLPDGRISSVMVAKEEDIQAYLDRHCSSPEEDSWIHHCLLYQHKSYQGHDRNAADRPVSPDLKRLLNEYYSTIANLLDKWEKNTSLEEYSTMLQLDDNASLFWKEMKQRLLTSTSQEFDSAFVPGMQQGLVKQIERCAAAIHLLHHNERIKISIDTMETASNLVTKSLSRNALDIILPRMKVIQDTEALVRTLVSKLVDKCEYECEFNPDEVKNLPPSLKKKGALNASLNLLLKMGHLRPRGNNFLFSLKPLEVPKIYNRSRGNFSIQSLPHADCLKPAFKQTDTMVSGMRSKNIHYILEGFQPMSGLDIESESEAIKRRAKVEAEYRWGKHQAVHDEKEEREKMSLFMQDVLRR